MIYLDMVLSSPDAQLEFTPNADHKFLAYKLEAKPKFSLWEMFKLKMMLEEGYKRLIKEEQKDV
jgi:hypothetical protein